MIDPTLLEFFRQLEQNNTKDWFNERKDDYKAMKVAFEQSIKGVAVDIAPFDERLRKDLGGGSVVSLPRIYRDTRFHPDNAAPLKTYIMAVIAPLGEVEPGYYLNITPGGSVAGGGLHSPKREVLSTIRECIHDKPEELEQLVDNDAFRKVFSDVLDDEDSLKNAPRGYSTDHPAIHLLRLNQYLTIRHFRDDEVTDKGFRDVLLETFEMQHRLLAYLRRATHMRVVRRTTCRLAHV